MDTTTPAPILFVLGTARDGRESEKVFSFVTSVARERTDLTVLCADVRDFPTTRTGGLAPEKTAQWSDLLTRARGIVIVAPEYNHSFPGELKLLLDAAYKEYRDKPVAICGVSNGPVGGARMAEQLKLVLLAFQATVVNAAVYVTNVPETFPQEGAPLQSDFWRGRVTGMLDELLAHVSSQV